MTATNPCATCGACCRSYIVPVFGHDLWLICSRQRLAPEQFVVAYPQKEGVHVDAFRLQAGGPYFGLMLDKRGPLAPERPCVFLFDLAGGHSRCGIYAERPLACQVYPMVAWSGVVAQRPDSLCPPDSWPLATVLRPSWRRANQRLRMHLDLYGEVAGRWNARVAAAPAEQHFVLAEYLSYLLNVYDRLAALDHAIGASQLAEVEAMWPSSPRPPFDPAILDDPEAAPLWVHYLVEVRSVIDGFYAEIPPLAIRFEQSPAAAFQAGDTGVRLGQPAGRTAAVPVADTVDSAD